jgi:hypothetical protein
MSDATRTSKGQNTIPKAILGNGGPASRRQDAFHRAQQGAIIVRVKNRKVRGLQGMLKSRRKVPVSGLSR